ncbi:MAG: hypothetical protein GY765_25165 [bacterium]|nr:hypothetical protein [bacterium]
MNIKQIYKILQLSPEDFLKQCKTSNYQASGPGGQKRNRKLSAVRLTHTESGLAVTASEYREPNRNLSRAVWKLRLELALSFDLEKKALKDFLVPVEKFRVNVADGHADFPMCVLAAFPIFFLEEGSVGEASTKLQCSSSALIRFFRKDKALWRKVQGIRTQFGHYPLK